MGEDYYEPPLSQAEIGGRRFTWREAGHGPGLPLLLLHGIGSNARAWAGQFAGLSGRRRVIGWNAPGYGGTTPLASHWPSPDDYAGAALDLADHLGLRVFVLIGQSLGAVVAAAIVQRDSARVAALVLTSPASGYGASPADGLPASVESRLIELERSGPEGFAMARASRLLGSQSSGEARAIVRAAMAEVEPHGYAQAARLLAGADLPAAVAGMALPAMVVWGSEDVVTPPASCRAIARAMRNADAIEMPGAGHAVATELPVLYNTTIAPLLDAADRACEERHGSWT